MHNFVEMFIFSQSVLNDSSRGTNSGPHVTLREFLVSLQSFFPNFFLRSCLRVYFILDRRYEKRKTASCPLNVVPEFVLDS